VAQGKVPSFTSNPTNITHMEEGEQMIPKRSCGPPTHFLRRFTHRWLGQRQVKFTGVIFKFCPNQKLL